MGEIPEPETPAIHPMQNDGRLRKLPASVALAAYEVYSHIYSPQKAMITGGCRGGFSAGEIIAFLYARPFPKTEWSARVQEAFAGMNPGP